MRTADSTDPAPTHDRSPFHRTHRRALVRVVVAAAAAWVVVPGVAFAHIDADPAEVQAGSEQSIGFTVEHGCEGSPTTSLEMRLPDGVSRATPEAPDGWTGTLDGDVVTFTGGPLPADEEMSFAVRMTLPPVVDTTIYFPTVQRCEVGEIRWIGVPSDGSGDESEEPAPAVQLTGPVAAPVPPDSSTVDAPDDGAGPTTAPPTAAAPAPTAPATAVPGEGPTPRTTPATVPEPAPETTSATTGEGTGSVVDSTPATGAAEPDDGGGSAPVVGIVVIVALLAIAAVGVVVYRGRSEP